MGVIGLTVVLTGVALLVLSGPGLVVIALGLAILATEFVWGSYVKGTRDNLAKESAETDSQILEAGEGRITRRRLTMPT